MEFVCRNLVGTSAQSCRRLVKDRSSRRAHRIHKDRLPLTVRPSAEAVLNIDESKVVKLVELENIAAALAIRGLSKTEVAARMRLKLESIEKLLTNVNRKLAAANNTKEKS